MWGDRARRTPYVADHSTPSTHPPSLHFPPLPPCFLLAYCQVFFHCDQLFRGMYAVYLERWLRVFPREALLVIKAEDMFRCAHCKGGGAACSLIAANARGGGHRLCFLPR